MKRQMSCNKNVHATGDRVELSNAVAAERTKVESVELVLPPHTNHQVSHRCLFITQTRWRILDMYCSLTYLSSVNVILF